MNRAVIVKVTTHKTYSGKRVYVIGHRVHHGFTGCLLVAFGSFLLVHDRKDFKRWFKDLIKEQPERRRFR